MKRFIRIIIAAVLGTGLSLHAAGYDGTLLKAHARLLPKIMLLDKNLDKKLVNGKVKIVVVTESKDMQAAVEFRNDVTEAYQGRLMQLPLEIEIVDINSLEFSKAASALYILSLRDEQMLKAIKLAKKEEIISFAYNLDALSAGALVSVRLEVKTVIYFNRSVWQPDSIPLRPEFFKIARAYE